MKYKILHVLPEFETNTYLVWDEKSLEALLLDPAFPAPLLKNEIEQNNLKLKYVVNTHGHADHIGGNEFMLCNFKVQLCIHPNDAEMLKNSQLNLSASFGIEIVSPPPEILLNDGDELKIGDKTIRIIHTPGHTAGGICLFTENLLFSGDTLFCESIGRTDLPTGDFERLKKSIVEKLFLLPEETLVLPGHGVSTTIGKEKIENPFVGIIARL